MNSISHMELNPSTPPPSSSGGLNNFPILAIVLLAIMVTAFLLVSYYIIAIKCCLNWSHLQPLRRLSFARERSGPRVTEYSSWQLAFSSPTTDHHHHHHQIHRGLDELVLRDIPTFKYKTNKSSSSVGERSFRGCSVCLSEFEDEEMLRVLPHCGHLFHLDCIDLWLVSNPNCPLCRSNIVSGRSKRVLGDHIVAPSSSPQEIIPNTINDHDHDQFVVIEIDEQSQGRRRGFHHHPNYSIMGDECINLRMIKDDEEKLPIRRSFSMDSAMDQHLLLQVQQIIRQKRLIINNEVASSSNNRSVRRSFFSFGQALGSSKSAVLPI